MEKQGKIRIKIVAIVIVIILSITTGLIVMLKTDLFKSEKQLFGKYALYLSGVEKNSAEKKIKKYYEKRKNSAYSVEGGISAKIDVEDSPSKYQSTNNANIRFKGNVDEKNEKMKVNISLNYAEGITFPLEFKKVGEQIGLQSDTVGKKSIVFNNPMGKILEMTEKNSKDENVDSEEKEERLEKFGEILLQTVINTMKIADKECFTKVDGDIPGYRFTVTESQLMVLTKDALNIVKEENQEDEIMQKILGEMLEDFEEIEDRNPDTNKEESKIEVTIYGKNNKFNKIKVKVDETIIELSNDEKSEGTAYILKVEIPDEHKKESAGTLEFKIQYKGLGSLENIYETYEINLLMPQLGTYKYTINNSVKFEENIEIEEFNNKNSVILKDLGEEKKTKFLAAVMERLEKVNKKQMKELGILNPKENPMLPLIGGPVGYLGILVYQNALDVVENSKNEGLSAEQFNEQFIKYEGDNVKGSNAKTCKMFVEQYNKQNSNGRNVMITGDENIEIGKMYEIKCKKGNDGYIKEIEITEKDLSNASNKEENNKKDGDIGNISKNEAEEIQKHNMEMEKYKGTKVTSASVRGLLKKIIAEKEVEKKYSVKEINFNGKENEASLINIELTSDKIKENMDKIYQVDFEKDAETGSINRVIITEK